MGNSEGDVEALLFLPSAVDLHRHEFAGTLPVAHQALGQGQANCLQRLSQARTER